MSIYIALIGIFLCLCLSAFCSASEMSFSSCSTMRLENARDAGSKRAKTAVYITEHFDDALSAILIGNNLANIGASSLASIAVILIAGDEYAWVATVVLTVLVIIFGETMPKITAKQNEIARKEQEIADQWDDFKKHMAAMQELRDGGSVAMLSAVNDLYELLTFNEVMQDISIKDTEIMDNMKAAKSALEADKVELEAQRKELTSQKAELDTQNYQMKAKQSELNSSISAAQLSAQDAQKAQKAAQAAIESDELNYEAVKKEIQKLIAAAASSKPQLSFTGFACPLKSYTRVSSEYGWRKNPVSGVNKLHAGIDLAAPGGTPIYAAASGYVQVAGWSSGGYGNYVIIYHGKMSDGVAYSTLYGHMKSVATSAGKYVKQGELIGYVGSTGNSTGNHLHLEVWKGGSKANAVNPRGYIPFPHN